VLENGLMKGPVFFGRTLFRGELDCSGATEAIYDTEEGLRNAEAQAGY